MEIENSQIVETLIEESTIKQKELGTMAEELETIISDPDVLEIANQPGFDIFTLDKNMAEIFLRSVIKAQREINEIIDYSNSELEKIEKRRDELIAKKAEKTNKLKSYLGLYVTKELKANSSKAKSIEMFNGVVGFRKKPDKLVITTDETSLIKELKSSNEYEVFIKTDQVEKIDKKALKDFMKTNLGRTFNNAKLEGGEEEFYVKEVV